MFRTKHLFVTLVLIVAVVLVATVLVFVNTSTIYQEYDVAEDGSLYTYTPRGLDTYPVDTKTQSEKLYDRDAFIERVQAELTPADRQGVQEKEKQPVQVQSPVYSIPTQNFLSTTTEVIHETPSVEVPQIGDIATTSAPEIHSMPVAATSSTSTNEDQ